MVHVTDREREVLELATDGLTNDEMATRLGISRRTVEAHMRALFRKTGATRRAQLGPITSGPRSTGPADSEALDRRRLELYAAAVQRLAERHLPLVRERVEIVFTVSDRHDHDTVDEQRWTTPNPYLVYRMFRPVVADGVPDDADLHLSCQVQGRDIQADLRPVLDAAGRPTVLAVFQPGLAEDTAWTVHYRSPGLWDPLRTTGRDTLSWATATADRRHEPTTTELVVRIVLPPGWSDVSLREQAGYGATTVDRLPSGQTRITWRDDDSEESPIVGGYEWVLCGTAPH